MHLTGLMCKALGAGPGLCQYCSGVCAGGGLFSAVLRDFSLRYLLLYDFIKASGVNLFSLAPEKR